MYREILLTTQSSRFLLRGVLLFLYGQLMSVHTDAAMPQAPSQTDTIVAVNPY